MQQFKFKILHQDKRTRARVGEIRTAHGVIATPAFVPVGTQATVKSLTPQELNQLEVELFIVNTYHAYLRPGVDVITKAGGLHRFMNWNKPLITDSGGFQVFSLATGKFTPKKANLSNLTNSKAQNAPPRKPLVKIDDDGVTFRSHWDGSTHRFTPEKSIDIQHKLGADIMIAFDECAPYPCDYEYAKKAMERTHEWAERSLQQYKIYNSKLNRSYTRFPELRALNSGNRLSNSQALFGVVQGSIYKDLRIESARVIGQMDFDGMAIGGVSVGESKRQMRDVCDWVISLLPADKPRHLLGVGEIDDIFDIVERGVDTFDCVQPTRLARMGHLFRTQNSMTRTQKFTLDINKKEFAEDFRPIDQNCTCYTCQNFTKAYLHHLFHVRELLGYRLATIHNLYFVLTLVANIRHHIKAGSFAEFKIKYLENS